MRPPAKRGMHTTAPAPYGGDVSEEVPDVGLSEVASPVKRANRRKLWVFLGVFAVSCTAVLVYVFARPAEYRASARIQISPGSVQVESASPVATSQGATVPRPFLNELQVLTSRPVVEAAVKRLPAELASRVSAQGADPVAILQASLAASAASGTDVVELAAAGTDASLVTALVNEVIAAYKEQVELAHRHASREAFAQLEEELTTLGARVANKRKAVDDFSAAHKVVSLEREENVVLTRLRGLGTALNNANEKLAVAEGRLRSLEEAAAAGKSVTRARDNPTLANLEQRASQIREELRELERSYTAEYLAMDNRVRAQRVRLAELELQIASQRRLSEQSSLAEAREEVASARETANRIRQQIAVDSGAAQIFSSRFNEYKGLREELAQLEALHRDAAQRKARLEAGERARRPTVRVVEAAILPQEPWRPQYTRDAAVGVTISLLLALFLMWLVELFNRHEPQPMILVPQPVAYSPGAYHGARLGALASGRPMLPGAAAPELSAGAKGLLAAEHSGSRELAEGEIGALLAAATGEARLAALLLLNGLSTQEIASLHWDQVDLAKREIRIEGGSPRTLAMLDATLATIARQTATAGKRLLEHTPEELTADLLCAAYDAGIERPTEVTLGAIRHTYVAFLARQGMRLADLAKVVGRLPADQVALYSTYAPAGKRLTLDEVKLAVDGIGASAMGQA